MEALTSSVVAGRLYNDSFAASDVSFEDSRGDQSSTTWTPDGTPRRHAANNQQQTKRRRKSDLNTDGELTRATELTTTDNAFTQKKNRAKEPKQQPFVVDRREPAPPSEGPTAIHVDVTVPQLPSLRDAPITRLSLYTSKSAETEGRRNTGSEKCAPVASAGNRISTASSAALKNFDFSPIQRSTARRPSAAVGHGKGRGNDEPVVDELQHPMEPCSDDGDPTPPIAWNHGAPRRHGAREWCVNSVRRAGRFIPPWVQRAVAALCTTMLWLVHTLLSSFVTVTVRQDGGASASKCVTLELLYGAVRLQCPFPPQWFPQQPHDAAEHQPMTGASCAPTSSGGSVPPHDVGELRRAVHKLELRLSAMQETVVDTQGSIASLEGVVGGLHYLIEQHEQVLSQTTTS